MLGLERVMEARLTTNSQLYFGPQGPGIIGVDSMLSWNSLKDLILFAIIFTF